ncbi:LysR family transcriptional regulator [Liquorilactobacillus satsumensis]|uniref:LysR family transcriptional regulator n=2 Tax=Liquorilactobacillus satsumensis TaxID=259059 RepID=A0A0R1V1C1_9LACO|nr:LysR family transcriptional regulator [Liquorilactobacillus satsumensis]KRL97530.1 LysR family transcriptional regulator [Liquorilactobacillus satsumensis DSM 16230 = JCM 12392]MCC7666704.1 LysR family transcriptional regulator [Liquorilactobacillus satsumensis]MCP9312677.1 LysR family transcriptional regulator [Liquorilactobacillus satsumensis]MCP9327544.1 LysR family transcriptional regulator [Liquorilactobacillus satsumensis]MCP9357580.1 LysR family transcriptional regulator [Liquorilact
MTNFSYEVFSEVAKRKTFFAAATQLNVTPSAISHSVAGLEKELGFSLFVRNRTGVKLTSDGKKVLPVIQEILNTEAKLKEEAARINGLNEGRIRIGAFSSVCINWLPDIIRGFKKDYPKIELSVTQGNFNAVAEQVRVGTLDLGFSALPIKEKLEVIPLHKDPIFCITPQSFTPRGDKIVTRSDLQGKNFILQQIDYDRDTKKALDTYDVSVNSIHYSIDDASIIAMVESGLGMGILPELALQKLSGNVNRYPFQEHFYRTVCLVSHAEAKQTPSTRAFVKAIQDYLLERYGAEDAKQLATFF